MNRSTVSFLAVYNEGSYSNKRKTDDPCQRDRIDHHEYHPFTTSRFAFCDAEKRHAGNIDENEQHEAVCLHFIHHRIASQRFLKVLFDMFPALCADRVYGGESGNHNLLGRKACGERNTDPPVEAERFERRLDELPELTRIGMADVGPDIRR